RLRLRVLPSAILVGCRAFPRSLVVFALVFFPCFCRLLRRLAAVLSRAARARLAAELLPVLLGHVHAVMLRRLLDVGEGELAVLVGHPNRLIEAGDRVSDVARVGQRFLALFRKGEHAVRQVAALGETSVLLVGFPGGFHGSGSISRIMPPHKGRTAPAGESSAKFRGNPPLCFGRL